MSVELRQDVSVQLGMRVSPRLVAASHMLELSAMQLEQEIAAELADNPALEALEQATCPVCGGSLHGSICPTCLAQQKSQAVGPDGDHDGSDDYVAERSLATPADDDFDPLTQVGSRVTLSEHLLNELRTLVHRQDVPIAEYLVGSLDDQGYLCCSVDEVSEKLAVSPERVEAVLELLHSLEPVGIGARDLRECLLIQLSHLAERRAECPPYTRQIVADHLHDLGEHRYHRLATTLGTTQDVVVEAASFIRRQLNPFPARGYSSEETGGRDSGTNRILPDVVISRRQTAEGAGDGFEVEVVESARFQLRVTPFYHRLAAEVQREPGRFSDEERRHIAQYVSRGRLFIANINQRRQTMQKITEFVIEVQGDFLRDGIRRLKPLTRATVSSRLGVHESTVSRATANKYVMLPDRRVIPFSDFFTPSLSVLDVIKNLIGEEGSPLADQEIAAELARRGILIARRTVAKYRSQLRILPSSLRQTGPSRVA